MLNLNEVTDLPSFLKNCIQVIKDRSPNLSSNSLSAKLRISNSTFGRIENLEVRKPTFDHALKIVRAACNDIEVKSFVEKYYPNMLANFMKVYSENSEVPFVKMEAEAYFEDPTTYEIMMMATTSYGLTREKTLEEFGKRGLITLQKLIDKGVLIEINSKISNSGNINAGQETVQKLFLNLVGLSYDASGIDGDLKNWLSVQFESVDKNKVLPELSKIIHESNQKIRIVLNDPKNRGSDVVWAGLAVDLLSANQSDSRGVVQWNF